MFLIFDTETTGLPKNFNAPVSDSENWPRMVQLAWQLRDKNGKIIDHQDHVVYPEGYTIPFNAAKVHGITTEIAQKEGKPLTEVLDIFSEVLQKSDFLVGHNIGFDVNIVGAEYFRTKGNLDWMNIPVLDTKNESTDYCAIPGGRGGKFKWPNLTEMYQKLFGTTFDAAHNAMADVEATSRSFFELIRLGVISRDKINFSQEDWNTFKEHNPVVIETSSFIEETDFSYETKTEATTKKNTSIVNDQKVLDSYVHLHNHTSYSVLSATTEIDELIQKAISYKMKAVGFTDTGNMMGAFHFTESIKKANKNLSEEEQILGVVGLEIYISENYLQKKFTKESPDQRFTQVLLAKNKAGYKNLSAIASVGAVDGYYAGCSRVSKEIILEHKENVIALTGGLESEIPYLILNVGEKQAEEAFIWWKNHFEEDFYAELIDNGLEEQKFVNKTLIQFAKKHNVKCIAQNNTFYLEQKDANAHDILMCVRDNEKKSTPVGRGRGFRFGFPNEEFYFKSPEQMAEIFAETPEAIRNLDEIIKKIEPYTLGADVLLPEFEIPKEIIEKNNLKEGKEAENFYLKQITYEGANERYDEITDEIKQRLDFELEIIKKTGYPGYFLIVADIISEARKMDVSVGPGRGSAAGSAVAYCIGITNVDPIKYNLLFERFLNPDRVSLPDIDIDFDDRGREKVIQWVIDKYGKDQVAQIITYGKMAAKSAIRDTARVMDLPLSDADELAKLVPGVKLKKLFNYSEEEVKEKFKADDFAKAKKLIEVQKEESEKGEIIRQAQKLEGSLRNTGIHACGIIITPKPLREMVPITLAKDSDFYVTQFDNSVVEKAGLLKMDFLGLRTLTIIKDACKLIEYNHGITIDPEAIPLDDEKTYKLFQNGETTGIFQYESLGMKRYMKQLVPNKFEDLIAMNALYRPGPLEYIPNFIARKNGDEEIVYDLDDMKEILKDTYGITVYQEQVMLLSQKLANFTKGEADVLRKAMGKKIFALLEELYPKFIEGGTSNGHDKGKLDKIWNDWKAFASYAFNKSHSTCYAFVAYQTAYLKANYPAEFMASVLSNNMKDIKNLTFFLEECKRMDLIVLGPDVNESFGTFSVNNEGAIRFGMSGIKGVGSNAVDSIVEKRESEGKYLSIFDFTKKIDLRNVNKRTLENLAYAGAFDSFGSKRHNYFHETNNSNLIEKAVKHGLNHQENANSSQISLFGGDSGFEIPEPKIEEGEPWNSFYQLSKEKEVVGVYISGHPLDDYKEELKLFASQKLSVYEEVDKLPLSQDFSTGGVITDIFHGVSQKNNKPYGKFTLADYTDTHEFMIFGEEYMRFKHFLEVNTFVLVRTNITKSRYNDRRFINISDISLLSEAMSKMTKGLLISLNIEDLDENLVDKIVRIVENNPGDKDFKIIIKESKERFSSKLSSSLNKIQINSDIIEEILSLPVINYEIKT